MKKSLILMLCVLLSCVANAAEVTYSFSDGLPTGWTASVAPFGVETNDPARGTQFTSSSILTLSGVTNVTKVVVTCSTNNAGNSISVTVGGTKWQDMVLDKANNVEKTFSGAAASGDLKLEITRVAKSVYIKQIVVTGDIEAPSDPEPEPTLKLDADYKYSEPTVVVANGEKCSNTGYKFISNNILVETTKGAITDTYFGCNAGENITFTATKPIKGLVVDGYIKQYFDANVDNGDIYFWDAEDDAVEDEQVVAVLDIDNTSVTISCLKQMRCYNVTIYFEENPDIETGGELNYSWEPTEATDMNITFDEAYVYSLDEETGVACTEFYMVNTDYELDLYAYVSAIEQTGIAPGTYEINFTQAPKTVQASPGGDDYYDYPTCLYTDFYYDDEYESWFYDSVYYIISGTMTVAKDPAGAKITIDAESYYGSKLNLSFTGKLEGDLPSPVESAETTTKLPEKSLENGRVIIRHNGRTYTANGLRLKK